MIFDHGYLSGLIGDAETGARFSAEAELKAMLAFETALARAEAAEGVIPKEAAKAIAAAIGSFSPDMEALTRGTARDGVIVPELVRQLRAAVGPGLGDHVHIGATSQDVIDTSLALRVAAMLDDFSSRIDRLTAALDALEARDGAVSVFAHTRMQKAIEVTASRKIRSWRDPLRRHLQRLDAVRAGIAVLTFGGAAGTLDKLGGKGMPVARRMADELGLGLVEEARHSERDGQAALAGWLSMLTASLGKMGQDVALMTQNEVAEIRLEGGGGSSAMPHKSNPVGAEVLVTLARFNATLVAGMHQAMVHENERSGAAWTLEWMILPQMALTAGAALRTAGALVEAISFQPEGEPG